MMRHDGSALEQVPESECVEHKADFSYREKDLLKLVNEKLNEELRDLQIVDGERRKIKVNFVRAYGEAFRSTRKMPKHNGNEHASNIFSLRLEIQWYGRECLGQSTLGSATGKIKVGEIDSANFSKPESWDVEVKLDIECPIGMPQQDAEKAGAIVEASEVELALKTAVKENFPQAVLPALVRSIRKITSIGTEEQHREAEAEKESSSSQEGTPGTSTIDCPDLRRQLLGKEYLRVVDGEAEGEVEWKLRFCTINDRDMEDLCSNIKKNSQLKKLDFYFNYIGSAGLAKLIDSIKDLPELETLELQNNKIGDEGVQALMSMLALGGAPKLKLVNLKNNPDIGSLGRAIVDGFRVLRKGTLIELDP